MKRWKQKALLSVMLALPFGVHAQTTRSSVSIQNSINFNAGQTYSYGDLVLRNGIVYLSQANSNTDTPGSSAKWLQISSSGGSASVPGTANQILTSDGSGNLLASGALVNSAGALGGLSSIYLNGTISTKGDTQPMNSISSYYYSGGRNFGNPGTVAINGNLWTGTQQEYREAVYGKRGIHQSTGANIYDAANGDFMGMLYAYIAYMGGCGAAASDEGCGVLTTQFMDFKDFVGTVATGGAGNLTPTLNNTGSNYYTNDGGILLDTQTAVVAGNFNGKGATSATGLPSENVAGVTLPLTTAWGNLTTVVPDDAPNATDDTSETLTVNLGTVSGTKPGFKGGTNCTDQSGATGKQCYAVIAGPEFSETVKITSVGTVSNNTQSVVFTHHYPHSANAVMLQGGLAGTFISSDEVAAYTASAPAYQGQVGPRMTGIRAYGSLTGTDLLYGFSEFSSAVNLIPFDKGHYPITSTGGFHIYRGAEVVANTTIGHAPQLETNPWLWTVGDSVDEAHNEANVVNGFYFPMHITAPTTGFQNNGIYLTYDGAGISDSWAGINLYNVNPCTMYIQCKNPDGSTPATAKLNAPDAIQVQGIHNNVIDALQMVTGGTFANINQEYGGTSFDPIYLFKLFCQSNGLNLPGCQSLMYDPTGIAAGQTSGYTNGNNPTLYWSGDIFFPNVSNYILHQGCYAWTYNSASPIYKQICDVAALGSNERAVSFDGDARGDHALSIYANNGTFATLSAANGFTGTKTIGTCTVQFAAGIVINVTGC